MNEVGCRIKVAFKLVANFLSIDGRRQKCRILVLQLIQKFLIVYQFQKLFLFETRILLNHVTDLINNLVDLAISEKDHATNNFLQWFVSEQVEEEASVAEVVEKLKLIQDNPSGLFMMDAELGKRVFTMPATPAT